MMIFRRAFSTIAISVAIAFASWPAFGQATLNFNAFTLQGQIPNANILNPLTTVNGVDCTLGSTCTIPGSASIGVGSTTVTGGTSGRVLYDNAGTLGELPVTGSGSAVLATSPTIASPTLTSPTSSNAIQTGTSTINAAAIGGCTIGTDAFCATGTGTVSGNMTVAAFVPSGSTVPTNGLYLPSANTLGFSSSSALRFTLASTGFNSNNGSGASIRSGAASATAPTLVPNLGSTNTGIGASSSGTISAIVGGVEQTRLDGTGLLIVPSAAQIQAPAGTAGAPSYTFSGDTDTGIYHDVANQITFSTNGTESFRIGSTNNLGIGGAATAQASLQIIGAPGSAQASLYGFRNSVTLPSTATGTLRAFYADPSTAASAFTATTLLAFNADLGTIGAGSAITNYEGFRQTAITGPGTIKAFRGLVAASGTNNYNLYMDGTAPNLLAGDTSITSATASTTTGTGALVVTGGAGIGGALNVGGNLGVAGISASGAILTSNNNAGIGYTSGAGGTVTQATSRTTAVTINTPTGRITLVNAAGSTTPATFTVNNSAVGANDSIVVVQKSGTNLYEAHVTAVATGSFNLTIYTTGGTTTEQPVFNFAVVRGAAS